MSSDHIISYHMKHLFRNPIWWAILFALIGLLVLILLRDNKNAMEYFLTCVGIGISASVVDCSIKQNYIQKDNIRIQLFDKRYNVYKSLIDTITILQRDDWDRHVLLNENDINKQIVLIEDELYKSVYLSECLFDSDVFNKMIEINGAFCKVASSYKNILVANIANLNSQEVMLKFSSTYGKYVLSDSPTALQEYNETLKQELPAIYESLLTFSKDAEAYVDFVSKSGILTDIKKYIRVDKLDS